MSEVPVEKPEFPSTAGIIIGLGLGGFFDGIVFHQILQWHHLASSAGYPPNSLDHLRLNVLLDGLFHAVTYSFTIIGLVLFWHKARQSHSTWAGRRFMGAMLMGWGLFNLVEGVIDHHLLGLHHVNETAPIEQWIYWDLGFLLWGSLMLVGGWRFWRAEHQERAPASEHTHRVSS